MLIETNCGKTCFYHMDKYSAIKNKLWLYFPTIYTAKTVRPNGTRQERI